MERLQQQHQRGCPPPDQLAAYLSGYLNSPQWEKVASHLTDCEECQTLLDSLSSEESPLQHIDLSHPQLLAEDSGWQRLAARAQQIELGQFAAAVLADERTEELAPRQLGPYQLLEMLGQGGMGTVYRGRHVNLQRDVAIKLLPKERTANLQHVARFYREMAAIGKIDSPHVVRASDAGEADGWHFLVMEYVPGVDLSQLLRQTGPLPIADACEIIRQAALGLAAVEQHGLVHRDVKPSNLLLRNDGTVKLSDLGLARLLEVSDDEPELTAADHVLGTADYMAPEQVNNTRNVDIRADIYSLGCTFYKLLTGEAPFSGKKYESRHQKMLAHVHETPRPIQSLRPDVPDDLVAVIGRMMEKEVGKRYASPAEVDAGVATFAAGNAVREMDLKSLEQSVARTLLDTRTDGSPPATKPVPAERSARKRARLHMLAVTVTVVAFALLAALGTAVVWYPRNPENLAVTPSPGNRATPSPNSPPPPPQWEQRLAYRPAELCWPKDGTSIWNWDEKGQRLAMQCDDTGMLQLGSTQQPNYRLRFALHQSRWVGGLDIFFGYHPATYDGKKAWKCQVISIIKLKNDATAPQFELRRGHVYHVPLESVDVERIFPSSYFAGHTVPALDGEQVLDIEVRYGALHGVRLNGVSMTNVLSVNKRFEKEDYIGGFGIGTMRSAVVVSDASYKVIRNPR